MKKETYEEKLIEKDERAIAPNIFIGLGGQGCKMVAALAKKAKAENSPAKYLSFVAIDTDVNELRKIKAASNDVVLVQTSSRMTIGEYLEIDDNARNNWFPINDIILDKSPSEGAGQIRAISNLVAHNAIREGEFTAINDAIDALFPLSEDNMEQSIHVTIMGTLAGGTGSGLTLPVALYVKNYIEQARQQKSAVIRGFFLLPDVMESVISSDVERKNQYSNAYASIREIDAFMRLPYDVELQKRYPQLKIIIPKVGGEGYDEYNNAPFNFCFLFNKINTSSKSLKSKDDLLKQAVECVYDMSVSPICTKVNSQEDNIIREKISSGNKASYAGAGASKLIYPYESVVDYVAYNWANGSISDSWLDGDKYLIDLKNKNDEAQNSGNAAVKIDENKSYIEHIELSADSVPFYKAIKSQTQYKVPNKTEPREKVDLFCKDLGAYTELLRMSSIDTDISAHREKCLENTDDAKRTEEGIKAVDKGETRKTKAENISEAVNDFIICVDLTTKQAMYQISQISDAVINADPEKNRENNVPVLEKYMYIDDDKKVFMHPNAARYFLMKLSKKLQTKIDEFLPLSQELKEIMDSLVKEVKIKIHGEDDYDDSTLDKIFDTFRKTTEQEASGRITDIADSIEQVLVSFDNSQREMGLLDEYCYNYINAKVFEKVKAYVDDILDGFKEFYTKISGDVGKIKTKIHEIETAYEISDKRPRSDTNVYVCASEKCFKKLNSECKNPIGVYDLPKELTLSIFNKAKNYAVMKRDGSLFEEFGIDNTVTETERKEGLNAFFGNVFENTIMEFWRSRVAELCSVHIDMNIVQAMYKEARIEAMCREQADKDSYVKQKVRDAKNLAKPFIDAPKGVQPREIRASAINKEVLEDLNDEKYFENECLDEFGPEATNDTSKYEILFYHSIYNIAAKNLQKMLPPAKAVATNSSDKMSKAGLYFSTYHERISKIEPLDSENTEISPHIQRDWQYLNVLPEVDPEYQKEEEKRIAKAFVYALISGKVGYRKHDLHGYNYCYELVDAKLRSPELIVSNGTNCDQFYEVLDALTICPKYVDRLLDMYESEKQFEGNNGVDFLGTQFAKKYSKSFVIEEFSSEPMMNIFYIPILYKASAGSNYLQAWGEALVAAIFEMINDIIGKFEAKRAVDDRTCEFLLSLYEEFEQNMSKLIAIGEENEKQIRQHSRLKSMANDSVTLRIYDEIAQVLENIDGKNPSRDQYADKVKEIMDNRRKLSGN